MLFNSNIFLFTFIPLLLIFYFLKKNIIYRNYILIIFSFFFYFFSEPFFSFFILLTLFSDFLIAKKLSSSNNETTKNLLLIIGIFYNLSILFVFKYLEFALNLFNMPITSIVSQTYATKFIILPLAISFITFTKISFLVDVFKGNIKCPNSINHLILYILFFPQLIAGPIIRYSDIEKEISSRTITLKNFKSGIVRFVYGLAKKVLLADQLSPIIDIAFDTNLINSNPSSFFWIGVIAFSLQIYLDFSAYSDMAVGLGNMFGFKIPENFRHPYLSTSLQDFWKNWHITLRRWFVLYVYVPILQKITIKTLNKDTLKFNNFLITSFPIITVFLLSGLWHGASLNFVFWGLFHGLFLILENILKSFYKATNSLIKNLFVLFIVLNGWVLFKAKNLDHAFIYYNKMYFHNENLMTSTLPSLVPFYYYLIMLLSIFVIWVFEPFVIKNNLYKKIPYFVEIIFTFITFMLCVIFMFAQTNQNFLYFRF